MPDTPVDFCSALRQGRLDVAGRIISVVLASLDQTRTPPDPTFGEEAKRLADWLASNACVAKISVGSGILKAEPPLKLIDFTAVLDGQRRCFTLMLRLGPQLALHALDMPGTAGACN